MAGNSPWYGCGKKNHTRKEKGTIIGRIYAAGKKLKGIKTCRFNRLHINPLKNGGSTTFSVAPTNGIIPGQREKRKQRSIQTN